MFDTIWSGAITELSVRFSCIPDPYTLLTPLTINQAIYPTVIIILVSMYMSQEDAISSFAQYHNSGSPPVDGNGGLSTIRFDAPVLATQTSSTMHEDRDRESDREQEGKLAIV